jgi:hypothetical protein
MMLFTVWYNTIWFYKRKRSRWVDGYYTGKTGNEYFLKLKQEQMMQVLYIFNSNRKIKTWIYT